MSQPIDDTGLLTSYDIASSESITVSAELNGVSADKHVLVEAIELVSIAISGPASIIENTSCSLSCTAAYSDSSIEDVE